MQNYGIDYVDRLRGVDAPGRLYFLDDLSVQATIMEHNIEEPRGPYPSAKPIINMNLERQIKRCHEMLRSLEKEKVFTIKCWQHDEQEIRESLEFLLEKQAAEQKQSS